MRIVMMGTGTFAEPTFEALLAGGEPVVGLVTQPDRDPGRRSGATRQTGAGMKALADAKGVPVVQPANINAPEGVAALRALAPDLVVVAAYGQILSLEVIRTPKLGMINVHASLLPRHRGASPVAHAILAGDAKTGVSIIKVEPALDAGEILAQEAVEIRPDETAGELETRLAPLGARLAVDVARRFAAGRVDGARQEPALVTRAPKLKKEQGEIDWRAPASAIGRHVRAMQPWPTAYTTLHRPEKEPLRVLVTKVRMVGPIDNVGPEPGSVGALTVLDPGRLVVPSYDGSSAIEVLELQPAGKNRMRADEFLRGYMAEGARFGGETAAEVKG